MNNQDNSVDFLRNLVQFLDNRDEDENKDKNIFQLILDFQPDFELFKTGSKVQKYGFNDRIELIARNETIAFTRMCWHPDFDKDLGAIRIFDIYKTQHGGLEYIQIDGCVFYLDEF